MQSLPPPTPGVYPGPGLATLLRANEQTILWQQNLIIAGGVAAANGSNSSASIAVQLERIKSSFYPWGASVQFWFTNSAGAASNPGAFELDVQTSDFDVDAQYVSAAKITAGLNTAYATRVELTSFWARFLRVNLISIANSGVYSNAAVTR
jgi:hypothetical protein